MNEETTKKIVEWGFSLLMFSLAGILIYSGYLSTDNSQDFRRVHCFNSIGSTIVNERANNLSISKESFSFLNQNGEEITVTGATCVIIRE